ncbi:uncharacterized protein PFL1_02453 [Pseudozyma flocculosa PF-1]|uniref:tRNA ligase kinase domain-containing protein n=1 Tax=Pseudozyma flocculosa PF-1 TaxID=1277687 RepID=A0A061HCL5_9BASI|nr:uncharacterized protein PFL1_02453 [Pseudozyma flocculosa PF-1]EPQ29780.1 hypothetical protein PFL1_02453 [Pseudozyma flocculosa PF-1]
MEPSQVQIPIPATAPAETATPAAGPSDVARGTTASTTSTPAAAPSQTEPPSSPPSTIAAAAESQHLIVLCGLIGSGKSTFALSLQSLLPNWVRCNQDVLGSREAVAVLAWRSLANGQNVIIDRTNVDVRQRRTWLQLGRDILGSLPPGRQLIVSSVTFTTPFDECERRLRARTDHETLHDPQQAVEVLHRFCSTYTAPRIHEGFHCCIEVAPHDLDLQPTREQVEGVVRRIEACEKASGALPDDVRGYGWGDASSGRGRGTGRGRGGFRGSRSSVGQSALYAPHGQATTTNGGGAEGRDAVPTAFRGGPAWGARGGPRPRPPRQMQPDDYDRTSGVPPWRQEQPSRWLSPRPVEGVQQPLQQQAGGAAMQGFSAAKLEAQ